MEALIKIYYSIGDLVCHQLPGRTIFIDEIPLPLCARDLGIYLGVFIALMYCIVRGKLSSDNIPTPGVSTVLALLMIPMMLDGITSYISIRETDNVIRLVTGIFFGMPIVIFLVPAANFKVNEINKARVVDSWIDVIVLCISNILVCVFILGYDILPWVLVSSACIVGLVFLIGRLIFTLIRVLNIGKPNFRVLNTAVLTVITFGLLYIFSNYLVGPARELILQLRSLR